MHVRPSGEWGLSNGVYIPLQRHESDSGHMDNNQVRQGFASGILDSCQLAAGYPMGRVSITLCRWQVSSKWPS